MKHLEESNLTYLEHYARSLGFAWWCFKMYTVCLIHAVFPFWHTDTFSSEVLKMHARLEKEKK